ncbi:MAG: hypothetical protein CL581_10905 [Alteromonadaceae bacterium]|nr:hypothetical protein [Alteromonadaceae bacterium]|tara:strand:+ start:5015 stop:5338 length:324 start_codon:yes stop_codon:yes gene_type:complete
MKTRKVGEATFSAAETGTKYVTWSPDYRGSDREKGAVHVRTSASGMAFTSKIQGVLGPTDASVFADLTSAESNNFYHKDIPLVRFERAEIVMSTNPNGGNVEVYVLE